MEKPTETITNKIFNYFENNHQGKNWTLFLIILGIVHSAWFVEFFHRVSWWQWALQIPKANFDIGTQNPYFIFLEILFIASSITRILIAIDIFYIIETCPVLSDWITLLWKKRRDEWKRWEIKICELSPYISTTSGEFSDMMSEFIIVKPYFLYESYNPDTEREVAEFLNKFKQDGKIPNHIVYWIKLEIKYCKKAIAKAQKRSKKSFLDKTIIVGKKIGKYILSHVQKH